MKEKKLRKNSVVVGTTLALAMALSVGTVAFAATDIQTKADNASDVQTQQEFNEYGTLTDSEITQLKGIYDRYDEIYKAVIGSNQDMTEEEFLSAASEYQDEIKKLEAQEYELEKKAGVYGNLTDDEIAELEGIYERYEAIYEAAIGDTKEDMTEEKLEAALAPYEEELKNLESREYELEKKAGWYDEEFGDLTDDDTLEAREFELEKKAGWYGNLTDEEISQLESLYNRVESIFEQAIGNHEGMTDEELESALAQYKDEIDGLEKQIDTLEQKAGFVGAEG